MELEDGVYVYEASELGWPPGQYPARFMRNERIWGFASLTKDSEGDVMYWTYMSGNVYAKVFND